jgi:type IV secretion system protein VirD4
MSPALVISTWRVLAFAVREASSRTTSAINLCAPYLPSRKTWRIAAALIAASIAMLAITAAAAYASAVLFLLLHRADPRQAEVDSIVRYWDRYSGDPRLRKELVGVMLVSGLVCGVALPAAAIAAARKSRPLHGAARFATAGEIARAGLLRRAATRPSILVGRHRGRFLSLPGQLSVMLSAPTRSGKGVGVVIPNLLNWPDSVVVLDVKGENWAITAGYRAEHGQAVYAFSPFDEEARSHRWNPLSAVRPSPLHRIGDLLTIGQVFFPADGSGTSSEAFFNDQARNLFLGLGLYLLETPALPRTIGEMLRQSSGMGQTLKGHFEAVIAERAGTNRPLSDECIDALQRLLATSENTLTSIVATFNAPLTIFADAVVDAATSADDFRLHDVRRQRMSIYVRIPPNRLAQARPLLNLFFSQLVSLNTVSLPEHDAELAIQCLLVLDEFAALGRVPVIASATAFLAGYNLRLLTVVQAMSQLDAVYGEKEARTFATNHGLQILFAPREQRDADEYSAMLGHFSARATSRGRSRSFGAHGHNTISTNLSDQRRALLLAQEFKEIGAERLVVIAENCKPILGEKIRYHREKIFRERLRAAPAVPALVIELHLARIQERLTDAPDELASGKTFDVARMAASQRACLPDMNKLSAEETDRHLDAFFEATKVEPEPPAGGAIEPVADRVDTAPTTEDTAALEHSARSP